MAETLAAGNPELDPENGATEKFDDLPVRYPIRANHAPLGEWTGFRRAAKDYARETAL